MAADAGIVCHRAGLLLILALPMTVHAGHPLMNIGYTRNRADPTERRDLYHVSAAAVWTLDPTWRLLLAELAGDTNVDNTCSVWPAVARIGAIYTVKKASTSAIRRVSTTRRRARRC